MFGNRKNKTIEEKHFRQECQKNNDDLSILTAEMAFTYVAPLDLKTIREYGWPENDIERMLYKEEGADEITRLAAWIRECGSTDHGLVIEDDPYGGIDAEGNYSEISTPEVF